MSEALRRAEGWLRESRPIEVSRQLLEAASWRVATELVRRRPAFQIVEMHPAGGQADCLGVVDPRLVGAGTTFLFGRPGSGRVSPNGDFTREITLGDFWHRYLCEHDPRRTVHALEALAQLDPPPTMPASTPTTLVYRVMAAVTAQAAFGIRRVEGRNGVLDTSGYGGGIRNDWFALFGGAKKRLTVRTSTDLAGIAATRFWFLVVDDEPRVALECGSGRVWWRDGTEHDVMTVYREEGRRIGPTAMRVARDAFE